MNLPNKLTIFRILLVPIIIFIWLFPFANFGIFFDSFEIQYITISYQNLIILGIFVLASFTDFLDGQIARRKNMVTTFGKFADPIADKLLVNTCFIIMAYKGLVPIVAVIIMIARDTIVDCCRMIAAQNGVVVSAGFFGKLKTVLQMFSIIFVLLNNLPFELWGLPITDLLIWFATFVSISSGYSYFVKLKDYIFQTI